MDRFPYTKHFEN